MLSKLECCWLEDVRFYDLEDRCRAGLIECQCVNQSGIFFDEVQ